MSLFVDVLLPLPVANLFSYIVPEEFQNDIQIGKRVIIPFGKNKMYSALVKNIYQEHADPSSLKKVQTVIDDRPVVNEKQFLYWEWIADYYLCTQGDVMNAAFPASLKLQSETQVSAVENHGVKELSETEERLLEVLKERRVLTIDEIATALKRSSVHSILKNAFEKNLITLTEEITSRYKARRETYIRLNRKYENENELQDLFAELEKSPRAEKQLSTLMVFMKYLFEDSSRSAVKKKIIAAHEGVSPSSLKTLVANEILVEYDVIIDRIPDAGEAVSEVQTLNDSQSVAVQHIQNDKENDVTLLYGVTSSGKTEVYIHLIKEIIAQGKQVLYLLPEIALTTQLIVRLQKYFGDKVGVYHSRYSSNERVEVWNNVLDFSGGQKKSQVILGARSALFLPFSDLGLIIVDEEHDASYKQNDPAPRYNGRDAAIVLAKFHGAKTILGSATPSVESFYNAEQGRYSLVKLSERHGGIQMPEIFIADVREARRKKIMKSHFTPELIDAIKSALEKKEQVILFQNRRGFSNYIECRNCAYIPHCQNCSVTLTYHKHADTLKCHYCSYIENVPAICPKCGDHHLEVKGFGTEKVEEEISVFFPDASIARMDIDTTRTKSSFRKIISDFEEGKIDILVGTQMVTKGLDFGNVSTVGIINADQLLNFPDFRAFERSFQLMVQVSGRSGRKNIRGKVIIQTQQSDHWVIQDVVKSDYEGFYKRDLVERSRFGYPPYSRLIEITMRAKEEEVVQEASELLYVMLVEKMGPRILGPHIPLVSRIRNLYYRNLIIKIERNASASEAKKIFKECVRNFYSKKEYHPVQIIADVDPA